MFDGVMPKCECGCPSCKPRCGMRGCTNRACISVWMPRSFTGGQQFKFMCYLHYEGYYNTATKPIKGIDKPDGADESWRPSMMEVWRWGIIKQNEQDRRSHEVSAQHEQSAGPYIPILVGHQRQWTPQQRATMARLAEMKRADR